MMTAEQRLEIAFGKVRAYEATEGATELTVGALVQQLLEFDLETPVAVWAHLRRQGINGLRGPSKVEAYTTGLYSVGDGRSVRIEVAWLRGPWE